MLSDIPAILEEFIAKTEACYAELKLGPEATSFNPPKRPGNVGPAYQN
jgi:hypothetical protein